MHGEDSNSNVGTFLLAGLLLVLVLAGIVFGLFYVRSRAVHQMELQERLELEVARQHAAAEQDRLESLLRKSQDESSLAGEASQPKPESSDSESVESSNLPEVSSPSSDLPAEGSETPTSLDEQQ